MIYVVATTQLKPEHKDAYVAGARDCIAATRKEAGCIFYDGHLSVSDPNQFVFVERWESRDALNAHARSDHMKVWRKLSADFKASPTVIEIISDGKVEKL